MDLLGWRVRPQSGILPVFLLIFVTPTVDLYNLEGRLPLFKFGPESYLFGFSVAQHRLTAEETGEEDTLLVVGAPIAKPVRSQRGGPNAPDRPGGVYYCPVTTNPNDCMRVQMDAGGNYQDEEGVTHIKSDQWLGVSLKSQGPGGFLVSCAHRYAQQLVRNGDEEERLCGKCFLLNATSSGRVVEIPSNSEILSTNFIASPCDYLQQERRGQLFRKTRYGYMQAGSSISLEKDDYVLGTPGAFRWNGGLFDIGMPELEANNGFESLFEPTVSAHFYRTPTCFPQQWGPDIKKCSRFPIERDSYTGFSVATSHAIEPNSDDMFQAAGAPRGNNTGAVVFFKRVPSDDGMNLVPDYSNIVLGPTIGSSFGYSVALTDINGDGLDDLIVGAPQYYEYGVERKAGGAVYVYVNEAGSGFRGINPQVYYGPLESYFGHAVAALGDIDQDGYSDFAVGSPYENENGVVHIFRGSESGIAKKSQTINGKDYSFLRRESGRNLMGFGASLSGATDADSNKYPDLLIGSFSDHAALIRSKPIITINMSLEVDREEIDLDEKPCSSGGEEFSCFQISYCFTYQARHSEYTGEIPIRYKMVLDSIRHDEGKVPRTYLDAKDGPSEIVNKLVLPRSGFRVCPGTQGTRDVYFGNGVQDRLSNIGVQIELELDLQNDVQRERVGEEIFSMMKIPILDEDFEKVKKKVIRIKNSCGKDGCQSNLKINATMPSEVVVGNDASLPLTVYLSNDREEAHQAHFTVALPSNVDYENFSVNSNKSKIVCYPSNTGKDNLIRCDIGNPYRSGEEDEIEIKLGVSRLTARDKMIQVSIEGYTSSENPDIPPIYLQAYVWIELDLSLTMSSQPQQVRYAENVIYGESGMNTTDDIGPPIQYTFDVKNKGSGLATGVELSVNLPTEIFNGKWLLYLVASDVTAGGDVPAGKCSSEYVNILRLEPSLPVPGRIKRDIEAELSSGRMVQTTLSCSKNSRCVNVRCLLDVIPGGTTTSVILQVRLWEATFLEEKSLKRLDLVHINTGAQLATSEENVRFVGDSSGMVQTTVDHDFFKDDITGTFPWWYILIAVILLLLLYILVLFLLIKCGFFKRKKHQTQDENADAVLEE